MLNLMYSMKKRPQKVAIFIAPHQRLSHNYSQSQYVDFSHTFIFHTEPFSVSINLMYFPLILLLLFLYSPYSAIAAGWFRRDPISLVASKSTKFPSFKSEPSKYKWTEEWFEQMPIDHFAFGDPRRFRLRYLINTDNFVAKNAPIFFYTGNEGGIEGFAENTGFMWDLAPEFGAAIVFAEHRYYGKTMPFGNESYSSTANLGYLSSEQALADFAVLIGHLKEKRLQNALKSPVIAFGGSYGGMLTAWMRIKYPHLIDGGIAASAPVFWFTNVPVPPEHAYDDIVARTFSISGCTMESLRASFEAILDFAKTPKGRTFLNEHFRLAPSSQVNNSADGAQLVYSIKDVMETMAMVDYPYESNFLAPLPAWPVKESCKAFAIAHNQQELALASYQMLNIFYNYTGKLDQLCLLGDQCPGPFSALGDPDGWPWQSCTEMVMPMCSRGLPHDPFDKNCPYEVNDSLTYCRQHFGRIGFKRELFRPKWAITNYGAEFPTATNLVFSNGWLDPWSGGGWRLKPTQEGSLISLIVEDGAHHYDLRGTHPNDTESVKEVRQLEKMHIQNWIHQSRERHRLEKKATKERIIRTELINI